jgi:hypothetical protein
MKTTVSGFRETVFLEMFDFDDLASPLEFFEHRLLLTGGHF